MRLLWRWRNCWTRAERASLELPGPPLLTRRRLTIVIPGICTSPTE